MKKFLLKINFILTQFGLNPIVMIRSFRGVLPYFFDFIKFRRQYTGKINFYPCLHDRYDSAGAIHTEYFWQDLLVAQMIFDNKSNQHLDIGSRLDGFVAHVASFRKIDVLDIRPVEIKIPNLNFVQADLMSEKDLDRLNKYEHYESISCLHALEHFGLGRYSDPVMGDGYKLGLRNIIRLLMNGGVLYLAVPLGSPRVEFNANHVFDPYHIIDLARDQGCHLINFITIDGGNRVVSHDVFENFSYISECSYRLGIFIFNKR
jgi:hypothetical protein